MFEKKLIKKLQDKFFNRINKDFDSDILFIFKGFSFEFYLELSQRINSVNDISKFCKNNKLDISKINNKKTRRTISRNFLTDLKGFNFCSFEEILVSDFKLEDLNCEIIFISNDFYQTSIINPTNEIFPDFEKEISSEIKTMDFSNEDFDSIFSFSHKDENDINLLDYRSLILSDLEDYKNILFFEFIYSKSFYDFKYTSNDLIKISNSNLSGYKNILFSVYNHKKPENSDFLISKNFLGNHKNELVKIVQIFRELGISINFYLDSFKEQEISPRKELSNILKKHWNSDKFRDVIFYTNPDKGSNKTFAIKQDIICEDIINQCEKAQKKEKFNDIFVTAPTGAGKSLFFQLPAIYLAKKDLVTIIISPLKSLMYDQVENLINLRNVNNATFLNSDLSPIEREDRIEDIKNGVYDIVYMSPELLLSYSIDFFIGERKIGLMAIDEAHLVSTWGRGFRVDYWYLGTHLNKLKKFYKDKDDKSMDFPIIALTATAVYGGHDDIAFETISSLNMDPGLNGKYIGIAKREDIEFEHYHYEPKGSYKQEKQLKTVNHIKNLIDTNTKSIAYFPFTTQINDTMTLLEDVDYGEKSRPFHSRLANKNFKKEVQDDFKNNKISVVLASKAFGMGVDISDIEQVYHHAPSGGLADYIQEIGRAARDKNIIGKAVTYFNNNDLQYSKVLFGLSSIKQYQIKWILRKILKLYDLNEKEPNMLASTNDFSHIFGDQSNQNGDIENKIQSCLMMIEKDFINKRGFPVVLARPKRLFGTVFAEISKNTESFFKQKYKKYIILLEDSKPGNSTTSIDRFGRKTTIQTPGSSNSIYLIKLDRMWEEIDEFRKINFATMKRLFYQRELFINNDFGEDDDNQPIPVQRLEIIFNNDFLRDDIIDEFDEIWDVLLSVFISFQGSYFTKTDFRTKVAQALPGKSRDFYKGLEEVLTIFKVRPKSSYQWSTAGKILDNAFLETKNNVNDRKVGKFGQNDTQVFRCNKNIYKTKNTFSTWFNLLIGNLEHYDNKVSKYININSPKDKIFIQIAQLLEFFDLATFEAKGGTDPKIFIRINDPNRLRLTALDDYYINDIASDVYTRFESSTDLMTYFFASKLTSKEKWDLVENYFLGKDLSDKITNFLSNE